MFVPNGNQPLKQAAATSVSDADIMPSTLLEFKQALLTRGVSATEIAWGDYKNNFKEIPPHTMERYLHHRKTLLHKDALALVLQECKAMIDHPFSLGE